MGEWEGGRQRRGVRGHQGGRQGAEYESDGGKDESDGGKDESNDASLGARGGRRVEFHLVVVNDGRGAGGAGAGGAGEWRTLAAGGGVRVSVVDREGRVEEGDALGQGGWSGLWEACDVVHVWLGGEGQVEGVGWGAGCWEGRWICGSIYLSNHLSILGGRWTYVSVYPSMHACTLFKHIGGGGGGATGYRGRAGESEGGCAAR